MTVKEVAKLLKDAERIGIAFGDRAVHIAPDDDLMLSVYGNYIVDGITNDEMGGYELNIALQYLKEGENA